MNLFFRKPIKKKILDYLDENNGVFYGELVKHLDYSANTVLLNLIQLKKKGLVFKDNNGGQFKLTK